MPSSGLLTIWLLLRCIAPCHASHQNSTCWQHSIGDNAIRDASPHSGIVVYYVSYLWCRENCRGFEPNLSADFALVLLGFALPAVIFSTVIPRRWRLDLPEQIFRIGGNRIFTILKLVFSIPTIVVVAALDMIAWITFIMTFAGPMLFSGVQEMILDYHVVQFLKGNSAIPVRERLEVVVALLCGNFDQDSEDTMAGVQDALIPSNLTKASLQSANSRLVTIMNAQSSFGITIGIPAVFFLSGFVYNAAQPTPTGTVSFGIFWMVLVLVTIVSGTLLAGNSPNTVSVLMVDNGIRRPQTRLVLLNDMYNSELYPVSMWERGFSKYQWIKQTRLWQNHQCAQQKAFKEKVEIDRRSWVVITTTTLLLVATPCALSWSFEYLLPWPWLGCLSLLYTIYLTTQIWLVLVALVLAYLNVPFRNIWRPRHLLSKTTPRSIFLTSCLFILTVLTGEATLAAALLTVIGSIFQFSDRFETCFCSIPVSSWLKPSSQRTAFLHYEYTSQDYHQFVHRLDTGLYWSAAIFTCSICFLGWWYQRSLRGALKEVIEDMDE
jgi:hypothetical protein